jgi:hypothetical protein
LENVTNNGIATPVVLPSLFKPAPNGNIQFMLVKNFEEIAQLSYSFINPNIRIVWGGRHGRILPGNRFE